MRISIVIYELFRFVAIILFKPELSIQILPLSWYVAVPLAFLPALLVYMAFFSKREDNGSCLFLYIISKILMLPGFLAYIIKDIPYAIALGADNNYYSLRQLVAIVLFFLIDVILIFILTIIIRKKQKNSQKSDIMPLDNMPNESHNSKPDVTP